MRRGTLGPDPNRSRPFAPPFKTDEYTAGIPGKRTSSAIPFLGLRAGLKKAAGDGAYRLPVSWSATRTKSAIDSASLQLDPIRPDCLGQPLCGGAVEVNCIYAGDLD
jgi:hypothetical protein